MYITAGAFLHSKLFTEDSVFVRGNDDNKTMAGHVTTGFDLRRKLFNNGTDQNYELVISPTKKLYNEYRCWIIDDEVISVTTYKRVENATHISEEVIKDFVKNCIRFYQPHNIFVMDVCSTDQGLRIVEVNGFNSSGFYNADIPAIMNAVNDSVYFGVKNFEKIA